MARVSLSQIDKAFGEVKVIENLNLEIEDREFVVLVGPSGCGKTTTLRMIAGLEATSGGTILIGDRDVTWMRPGLRNCAMVFQNYALYPHMTVAENITYGMRVRGVARREVEAKVADVAHTLGLDPYLSRRPKQLSGGQRQRVAIGRAIVRDPDVFLFDEPLSNLDAKLRIEMRTEIKKLHRRLRNTVVYVTHDQVEAMTMADRVVVMNQGVIEQAARPIDLYEAPSNRFVASFIGAPSMNFLPAELAEEDGRLRLKLAEGETVSVPPTLVERYGQAAQRQVVLGIRPEHMAGGAGGPATITLVPEAIEPMGVHTIVIGAGAGQRLTVQVDPHFACQVDQPTTVTLDMDRLHLFDLQSGKAL